MEFSLSATQISALRSDFSKSRKQLEPFRANRNESIKQFVGTFYSDNGPEKDVPMNVIELGVMTYQSLLVASGPAASVSTKHSPLKSEAENYQLALDHLSSDIHLEDTLQRGLLDSMFSMGIFHIALESTGDVEIDGTWHTASQAFVETIDLDDFVWDMQARRRDQCHFMGHCYEWRKDLLISDVPWIDKEKIEKAKPIGFQAFDEEGTGKAAAIGRGDERTGDNDREVYEMLLLWDIWMPMEGKIFTFLGKGSGISSSGALGELVGEREWYGPKDGPYVFLGFEWVPSNLMPLSPVSTWRPLADQINSSWRKLKYENEREKTVGFATGQAEDDANRVINANDGQVILVNDASAVKEVHFGGVNQAAFAFGVDLLQRWSYFAGNIDSLGGLAAQSDTARGEQLIGQSASRRVTFMANQFRKTVKQIYEHLAWYLCYDPLISIPVTRRVAGTKIEYPSHFTPSEMDGDYLDYNFDVQPYSLGDQTPQARLGDLQFLFQNFLLPLQQQMQASGLAINIPGLLKLAARLKGTPDLTDLVMFSSMDQDREQPPVGQPPAKAANTTRTYNRVSSGATPQAADQQLVQQMMASGASQQ